ncbi:hypothetical protein D8674_005442 [Pyrus ussuriensis x Pyrus communis]|uniref:Uncharacterized protein n=1 Tax=Pyrus ussuriensis x Pyrus communis TaxID=2448454 RepID=A0A5N5FRI0_9ROSA|nr:hypothetical protein D8674_005442 [Pyrus ussuriensis x Pyrus communis]
MQKNNPRYDYIGERPHTLAARNKSCMVASSSSVSSPRPRKQVCTCSNRPGLNRCSRHGYAVPPGGEKWWRNYGNKEVLRRALRSTPNRSLSLRWWNFQPTPSRLSNMSTA